MLALATVHVPPADRDKRLIGAQYEEVLVEGFVKKAVLYTGYSLPNRLPKIYKMEHRELARLLCNGMNCPAYAYFDRRTRDIYIDSRLKVMENMAAQSFVIHEIIHYLQYRNGKMKKQNMRCFDRMDLEREAYEVQNRFLAKNGYVIQAMNTRTLQLMCGRFQRRE